MWLHVLFDYAELLEVGQPLQPQCIRSIIIDSLVVVSILLGTLQGPMWRGKGKVCEERSILLFGCVLSVDEIAKEV